jgi:hypothetical protein
MDYTTENELSNIILGCAIEDLPSSCYPTNSLTKAYLKNTEMFD